MALVPPANERPVTEAGGQHTQAWGAYFQDLSDAVMRVHQGVTDGTEAEAGQVGEYLTASGSIGLTSDVAANAATVALPAGDWDVWGTARFQAAGGTLGFNVMASIGTVSAVQSDVLTLLAFTAPASALTILPTGTARLNLAADGSAYLVVRAGFSVSGMTCNGVIRARRVR
jgi:hypothetical protein